MPFAVSAEIEQARIPEESAVDPDPYRPVRGVPTDAIHVRWPTPTVLKNPAGTELVRSFGGTCGVERRAAWELYAFAPIIPSEAGADRQEKVLDARVFPAARQLIVSGVYRYQDDVLLEIS